MIDNTLNNGLSNGLNNGSNNGLSHKPETLPVPFSIGEHIRAFADRIASNPDETQPTTHLAKLKAIIANINKRAATVIHFALPILTRNGANGCEPMLYANTINLVTGKTGVHKSRIVENIASSFLTTPNNPNALLGLRARDGVPYNVAMVDTERNLSEQLPFAVQEIREKAGYERASDVSRFVC